VDDEPTEASSPRAKASIPARLFLLIAPVSLVGALSAAASFLFQTAGTLGTESITVIAATMTLAEAAGSALGSRLPARAQILAALCSIGVVLSGISAAVPPLLPAAAVCLSLLSGIADPLRAAAIQQLVADTARARAAS